MAKPFMQSFLLGPFGLLAAVALPLLLLHDHARSQPEWSAPAAPAVSAVPQLGGR